MQRGLGEYVVTHLRSRDDDLVQYTLALCVNITKYAILNLFLIICAQIHTPQTVFRTSEIDFVSTFLFKLV